MTFVRTRPLLALSLLSLALPGCGSALAALASGGKTSTRQADPDDIRNLQPGQAGYVDPGPYAGPLAKTYAGRIVFSKSAIPMDGADDSSIYKDGYALGDPLYVRFWSAESPHNMWPSCTTARFVLRWDLNGAGAGKAPTDLPGLDSYKQDEDLQARLMMNFTRDASGAFTVPSVIDPNDLPTAGQSLVRRFNSYLVPMLRDGDNDLRLVLTMTCGRDQHVVVAEGQLKVTVAPGARTAYLAKFGSHLAPSPHPENAKLVPQVLATMGRLRDWDNEVFLGARVTSKGWAPVRNEVTGVIVAQQVEAVVVVRAKKEANRDACRLFTLAFRRDPAGGELGFAGVGQDEPFPCGNAPK